MSGAPNYVDNAIWRLLSAQCPAMWLGIPIGTGNVYWVDSAKGVIGNPGTQPGLAVPSIIEALTLCTNNNNDYIMVIENWDEGATITVNKTRVHIIGLGNFFRPNSNHPFVMLSCVTGDYPIFTVSSNSNDCEIAGFDIGGGDAHAGIENVAGAVMGMHVHDCIFGHHFADDTPDDGIRIMHNATNIRIEHCVFLGEPGGKGFLQGDGIHWEAPGDPLNGDIENNQFKGLPGVAMNFVSVGPATGGITIKDNVISCKQNSVGGDAITLGASCRGFLVVGNKAMYGQSTPAIPPGINPYLDNAAVAPFNHWVGNMVGNAFVDPA